MYEQLYIYFFVSCMASFITGCLFTIFTKKIIENHIEKLNEVAENERKNN